MRIESAYPRGRALPFVAALIALAIIPAAASAASKKVKIGFSASAYSVVEGNTFNVTVLRTSNTRVAASVNYATSDGTAIAPGDYTAAGGTLNFAAGETRKTVSVATGDNDVAGPANKKLTLKLSGAAPDAVPPGKATATLTILDNDGPGTIDFSSATYSVVEGATVATITVTRASASNLIESVDYSTEAAAVLPPGTTDATAGTDYTTTVGTITFGVGEMSKTFQVPIADDSSFEGDEALGLRLANPHNLTNPLQAPAIGTNNPATLTIVDDDIPTFAFDSPTYSVGEENGSATITVTRGGDTAIAASVHYSDAGTGTATAGSDYTLTSGTLDFAPGETTKTFPVTVLHDTLPEGNETVGLQLTQNGAQIATALLSIVDDDSPVPSVQFSNVAYNVSEAAPTATVTVTLDRSYLNPVTVNYATANGTATAGTTATDGTADYVTKSGTLTFTPGQVSKTIDITINPDSVVEDPETFTVGLTNPGNATLGAPGTATVTIDDDDDSGTLAFSALRYEVNEMGGHATITVNRIGGSSGAVSVDYATSDGTAHAPGDYTDTHGTLTFADGETSKTFDIPIAWDGRAEGDETVSIALTNFVSDDDPSTVKAAVLHIADDGASGPVAFSAGSYDVSEAGGSATITVNRSGGSLGGPVTVDYATSDASAHAGTDYTDTHGTLTFGAGETSKSFQVPVIDDKVHQSGRTLNITLSNPGGGTSLGSLATAALNIGDDEPATSPSLDKTAPKLKLTAKRLQQLKTKRLVLKVSSNEAAKLAITVKVRKGSKRVAITRLSRKAAGGKTITIKLTLSKKALAKLSKALVKGSAKVTLTVNGTDAAGNNATVGRTITVK